VPEFEDDYEAPPTLAASPNVEYVEYILEDEELPPNVPDDLKRVVYDKELALTNLKDNEIRWLSLEFSVAEIMHRMRKPAVMGDFDEDISLSTLPGKLYVKLSRSRGGFERKQQTTQTIVRVTSTPSLGERPKLSFLGRLLGRGKREGGE